MFSGLPEYKDPNSKRFHVCLQHTVVFVGYIIGVYNFHPHFKT